MSLASFRDMNTLTGRDDFCFRTGRGPYLMLNISQPKAANSDAHSKPAELKWLFKEMQLSMIYWSFSAAAFDKKKRSFSKHLTFRNLTYLQKCDPSCHGTTCTISRINHLHPLTITRVLTNTCNHLPPPFISSLTSVTHQLVSRLHGSLHWSMSACLPVHPGTRLYLWKCKFTYSDTVHPASSALFIISLMLEALPELR